MVQIWQSRPILRLTKSLFFKKKFELFIIVIVQIDFKLSLYEQNNSGNTKRQDPGF
jgi:hypothetical protein